MTEAIYALCALTSLACALLLARHYALVRSRLLFWSALCFAGLTVSNVFVVVDKIMLPTVDLSTLRSTITLVSLALLIYGLVYADE